VRENSFESRKIGLFWNYHIFAQHTLKTQPQATAHGPH